MSEVVGKLVRGVIYDNVDTDSIREDMFSCMIPLGYIKDNSVVDKFMNDFGMTEWQALDRLKTMDVIHSIVRYDEMSDTNQNLIIPREVLSSNLEYELSKVDLGKNILRDYVESASTIKPEYFINSKEEKELQHVNNTVDFPVNKRPRFIVNGHEVSEKEFVDFIQTNPEMAEMLFNLKWGKPVVR